MSMLEKAEGGDRVPKEEFRAEEPGLRVDLINAQFDLKDADFPVIVLLAGDDRIGTTAVLNRLHEWMDARYLDTHVFGVPTDEEAERPRFWRYWRALPAQGTIGIFGGAWPLLAVAEKARGEISKDAFEQRLQQIRAFEGALVDDGALVLKFWIHLLGEGPEEAPEEGEEGSGRGLVGRGKRLERLPQLRRHPARRRADAEAHALGTRALARGRRRPCEQPGPDGGPHDSRRHPAPPHGGKPHGLGAGRGDDGFRLHGVCSIRWT